MLSDFKSRGFDIEDTQIQHPDRLARLLFVMTLALYCAVLIGIGTPNVTRSPPEKNA